MGFNDNPRFWDGFKDCAKCIDECGLEFACEEYGRRVQYMSWVHCEGWAYRLALAGAC